MVYKDFDYTVMSAVMHCLVHDSTHERYLGGGVMSTLSQPLVEQFALNAVGSTCSSQKRRITVYIFPAIKFGKMMT